MLNLILREMLLYITETDLHLIWFLFFNCSYFGQCWILAWIPNVLGLWLSQVRRDIFQNFHSTTPLLVHFHILNLYWSNCYSYLACFLCSITANHDKFAYIRLDTASFVENWKHYSVSNTWTVLFSWKLKTL